MAAARDAVMRLSGSCILRESGIVMASTVAGLTEIDPEIAQSAGRLVSARRIVAGRILSGGAGGRFGGRASGHSWARLRRFRGLCLGRHGHCAGRQYAAG